MEERFMRGAKTVLVLLLFSLVAGCAGYAPSKDVIGQSRASLVATMGQPEREYRLDDVAVLHFPRGPSGSHTYFVYIDGNDRVIKWEQVLTEARFDTIQPGMTDEQVIKTLGMTKISHGLARQRGYVWHYRYENNQCKSFVIEFATDNTVRSAGYRTRSGRRCKDVGMG